MPDTTEPYGYILMEIDRLKYACQKAQEEAKNKTHEAEIHTLNRRELERALHLQMQADEKGRAMNKNEVLMPRELTYENGAKDLLIGEFSQRLPITCPECTDLGDILDDCPNCNGTGTVYKYINIGWDNIKAIYKKAVEGLGVEPAQNSSCEGEQ